MNHEEQRVWMIRELLSEETRFKGCSVPEDAREQKDLLRDLMNVRPPREISPAFLAVQDAYLTEENEAAGITDAATLSPCSTDKRLCIWQGDITSLKIDAIVNAANSGMTGCYRPLHNCIDNCIHSRSGIQLRLKCDAIMQRQEHEEPTGQAKITPAYNLPCKYVLHTVGPIVDGELTKRHCELLASCYRSCLELAEKNGLKSVAFCGISTGVFRFPKERAAEIAVRTVKDYLDTHTGVEKVVFTVFSDSSRAIYENILH